MILNASERINAILMAALSSARVMLLLAIASGAGNEILQPLAIAVLDGLINSTALTLLVISAIYAKFGRLIPKCNKSEPTAIADNFAKSNAVSIHTANCNQMYHEISMKRESTVCRKLKKIQLGRKKKL